MGLPLFIAPVESDVKSKSPRTEPANSRSPIRRHRQLVETREQRLRLLTALQNDNGGLSPLLRARSGSRPTESPRTSEGRISRSEESELAEILRYHDREREREPEGDRERQRERERERAFERAPSYWRANGRPNPTPPAGTRVPDLDDLGEIWGTVGGLDIPPPPSLPGASRSTAFRRPVSLSRQASRELSRTDPTSFLAVSVARPSWAREQDDARRRITPEQIDRLRRRSTRGLHRRAPRVRYVDGLGDRDRSLSPEGDGVWDTLQSTLTPDPQPPSVGSSFASTNASAAASQSNTASSSNTSITSPDEQAELPCDPIENSDSEGESDNDAEVQRPEPSRRSGSRGRRSYADVAAETRSRQSREDAEVPEADRLEWMTGMHRIIRGLASRQDVPDEWWAQAGLSRSMSWEDPS